MTDIKPYLELDSGTDKIVVDRRNVLLFIPPLGEIRARYRDSMVYVLIGGRMLEMTTPTAVKVGLALCAAGGECAAEGDVVYLALNGEEFTLPPWAAVKLGGVICKKADRADDWQRANLN